MSAVTYLNLSELAAAASAKDCTVHMHLDAQSKPVFSVGNSNTGAAEFSDYFDALEFITDRTKYTAGDVAEQAGHCIGEALLNDLLAAESQALRAAHIKTALLGLGTLQHPDRAAEGFAVAMVNVIEVGLQNLPKGGDE
jgi:hypothetical protein